MSEVDPTDLLGEQRARAEAQAEARLLAEQQDEDFKWLMSDRRGRRIVFRLLSGTGVFRSSYTGDSETFFREGERNVGLRFLADVMRITPELFPTMLREQKPDGRRDDRNNRRDRGK